LIDNVEHRERLTISYHRLVDCQFDINPLRFLAKHLWTREWLALNPKDNLVGGKLLGMDFNLIPPCKNPSKSLLYEKND